MEAIIPENDREVCMRSIPLSEAAAKKLLAAAAPTESQALDFLGSAASVGVVRFILDRIVLPAFKRALYPTSFVFS